MRLRCVSVFASFALASAAVALETGGTIEGRLIGPGGAPAVGATIVAESPTLMVPRATLSDGEGRYRLLALPVGSFVLRVTHPSFASFRLEGLAVRLGSTTTAPVLELRPAPSFEERVEVFAQPLTIDPASTTVGGTLDESYFDNLPVARSYQDVATLLPHVNASAFTDGPNFAGATGLENRYFIDGVDVTEPHRGLTGTNLPRDFVQQVEVKIGGYEAEYRSALGGILNVVTPSGGDRLSGKVFAYWAGDRFAAEPRAGALEPSTGDFDQYDAGFSLGGPIVKERLRFFVAYNPAREREDVDVPGFGFFRDELDADRYAGKLEWQVDASNRLAFTIVGDPTERQAVGDRYGGIGTPTALTNPDVYLTHIETGGTTVSLRGTHLVGPRWLLESSFSRLTSRDVFLPATEVGWTEPLFVDNETGVWGGGPGDFVDNHSTQITLGFVATWSPAGHTVKGGFEYRENHVDASWIGEGLFRYSADFWQSWSVSWTGPFENRVPSAYVQDSWRIGDRWALNYGLRWDGLDIVGSDGGVAQRIDDQFQPRLGFVYLPGGNGARKVFGSAARFYQDLSTLQLPLYYSTLAWSSICNYAQDPRIDATPIQCWNSTGQPQPEIDGLRGQHFDELTLGYESRLGRRHRGSIRLVARELREILEDGVDERTGRLWWGNPGRGPLETLDAPDRSYRALELVLERESDAALGYRASYVFSRNEGNYCGLYNTDLEFNFPNGNVGYDIHEQLVNGTGPLPNDRTHVFKASGFYRFDFGLNVGSTVVWQSGGALSEMGGTSWGAPWFGFIQRRGTAGRTPTIFDLGLRLDYAFRRPGWRVQPRVILDAFHLFSDRKPVDYEQIHYYNEDADGNPIDPNPIYGQPTRYYPPATVRLGLEVSF